MICKSCKLSFEPIKTFSGLNQSKLCNQCRYNAEMAKRKVLNMQRNDSAKKVLKIGLKSKSKKDGRETDYSKLSLPELHKIAERHFNKFIRNRDELPGKTFYCPTCKTTKRIISRQYQACHCFPAGKFSSLKYNENNVFGGCLHCNYYQHGTNYVYNDWVREKIGEVEYEKLKMLSHSPAKLSRFDVIQIIETYKEKNKQFKNK